MKFLLKALPCIFTFLLALITTTNAEVHTPGRMDRGIPSHGEKTIQVVTACDGKKKVIVEGYYEGEVLPEEKARQTAHLLMDLMEFCELEITAKIPESEMVIQLSVNGKPFISVKNLEEIPLVLTHGGTPHSEREKRIWEAEMDRVIGEGYKIFHDPTLGANGISCDMCHPDASNTHPETYPKFQTQIKKVTLLREMINWCIENPLEGKKLAEDDHRMKALESYIISARAGKKIEPGKH
ncbi:MAG: hypothetical protein MRJ65_05510 [Candidatus Brocadiaceae bacterium]|nr:hypothetical protein [Candidatus Brocadiaceae bacterium]